jgi:RNA polymerase sigma-70 factor (ECF subfamily)
LGEQRDESLGHLVERWKAGADGEGGFEEIHQRFERLVYKAFPFWVPHEIRRELTQEVFSRVVQYRESGRVAEFEAWLFRIVKTTFIKWRQREKRLKRRGQEVPWDDVGAGQEALADSREEPVLDRLLKEERREELLRAIAELPDRMRQVLLLRVYHELSEAEIAATLHISEGTVKAHLAAARKRLREKLSGGDEND